MNADPKGTKQAKGATAVEGKDARQLEDLGSINIPQGGVLTRERFWDAIKVIFLR